VLKNPMKRIKIKRVRPKTAGIRRIKKVHRSKRKKIVHIKTTKKKMINMPTFASDEGEIEN